MPLLVEESDVPISAPPEDLSLELEDYVFAYESDAITAGSQIIRVTNSVPKEVHEVVIVKLNDGVTAQDFLAAFAPDAAAGTPPGQIVGGRPPLTP